MIQKIINAIRKTATTWPFESYLESLQRFDGAGAPTRDQARKDYMSIAKTYDN